MNRRPLSSVPGFRALVAAALLLAAPGAFADSVKTAHVEAELVAARTALVPGEPVTVALRLTMESGWHTYWRNPGDSGLPTTIAWTLPPGVEAGPIQWPAPRALPAGPLVNYGYEGEVLHLVVLAVARRCPPDRTIDLEARVDWLVCKETCIPEGVDLALRCRWRRRPRPIRAGMRRSRRLEPRCRGRSPVWQATARGPRTDDRAQAGAAARRGRPGRGALLSLAERQIEPSGRRSLRGRAARTCSTLPVANDLDAAMSRLAGVITAANSVGGGSAPRASTWR